MEERRTSVTDVFVERKFSCSAVLGISVSLLRATLKPSNNE